MDSVRLISLLFTYFGDFSLCIRSFNYIATSSLKSDVTFEFSTPILLYRCSHFQCTIIFGNFCEDNVCTCAVGALILLPMTNLSQEMDSMTRLLYDVNISPVNQRLKPL